MYRGYDRGGKADEPGSFSFYIIYVFISIFFWIWQGGHFGRAWLAMFHRVERLLQRDPF